MGRFVTGDVVVVRFPFTDLTSAKRRPALVLAALDLDDYILCQITSQAWHEPSIEIGPDAISGKGLRQTSYARPDRLFTANEGLIEGDVGQLEPQTLERVKAVVRKVLG